MKRLVIYGIFCNDCTEAILLRNSHLEGFIKTPAGHESTVAVLSTVDVSTDAALGETCWGCRNIPSQQDLLEERSHEYRMTRYLAFVHRLIVYLDKESRELGDFVHKVFTEKEGS